MKYQYLIALFLLIALNCNGQSFLISGVVLNQETHQPIAYATVSTKSFKAGTITNQNGRFKINTSNQDVFILISCIGFEPETLRINPKMNFYEVLLVPGKSTLAEVVVTGVSKATLVRENPIPVIGISTKKLEQTMGSNVIDILVKNAPGLNAVKTGPNISKPFIRGLGYNRVLTLYDGIRQEGQQWGDEHGIEVDGYNIDRAEVVKGPSSLIYGSDAVAGVVGLMPAMPAAPDSIVHGKLLSEYQSNNSLVGNALRLTYSKARWSYALRGSYRIAKNYQNAVDGRVYNSGFRETNASGTVKYTSDKGYSSLNVTLYDNLQGIPDGSRDSVTRKFTKQVFEGSTDDITNRPIVPNSDLNSYRLSPLHQHIQHYRFYTKNNYQIGKGNMDAVLAFQQNIRREYNHPTQTEQAGMYVKLNTVNYGLSYHVPAFAHTEISFGLNGMYQRNTSLNATDFPVPDYSLFDAGAYGFAKWKYNRWTASAGLRYDRRYLQGSNFYTQTDPVTGFDSRVTGQQTVGAYLQFPGFNQVYDGISLSLGITYRINEQVSLKANVARGYRAPSITEFASNGLDPGAHIIYKGNRNFVPEFSLQEDIGIETSNQNFSATLSIFNNHISNYIFLSLQADASGNAITDAQGNKTYQYQQSGAQLYGAEATIGINPSAIKGLSFDNVFTATYGFNRSSDYRNTGLQGEYLPLIPPLRLLSSISQDFKLKSNMFASLRVQVSADINFAQNKYLALNNSETYTAGFTLFDLSAGTTIHFDQKHIMQFLFQVNNLFGLAYQSNLNRLKYFEYSSQSPNNRSGIYNMGRNVGFKAIIPF